MNHVIDDPGGTPGQSFPMRLFTEAFIRAVNHAISQSPWASERLIPFAGTNVRIDLAPAALVFAIDSHGQLGTAKEGAEPEVTLGISAGDLPKALTGEMSQVMNAVRITGNAELADALGFVFRNLRWDVEEDLSRVIGDIPAHRLVEATHALRRAHEKALESIRGNVAEYVVEEQKLLLGHAQADDMQREVLVLRDDIARLEKRVERILKRRSSNC